MWQCTGLVEPPVLELGKTSKFVYQTRFSDSGVADESSQLTMTCACAFDCLQKAFQLTASSDEARQRMRCTCLPSRAQGRATDELMYFNRLTNSLDGYRPQ